MAGWGLVGAGTIALCILLSYGFLRMRMRRTGRLFGPRSRWWAIGIIVITGLASAGVGLGVAAATGQMLVAFTGVVLPGGLSLSLRTQPGLAMSGVLGFPFARLYELMGDDLQDWCDARVRPVVVSVTPQSIAGAAAYYYAQAAYRLKDSRAGAELSRLTESIGHKLSVVAFAEVGEGTELQAALASHPSTQRVRRYSADDPPVLARRLTVEAENELYLLLAYLYRLGCYELPIYQPAAPAPTRSGPGPALGGQQGAPATRGAGRGPVAVASPPPEPPHAKVALPRQTLQAKCPDSVALQMAFSLLVSVLLGEDGVLPDEFVVPSGGLPVLITIDAPGLLVLSDSQQSVLLSAAGTSDPVMFELTSIATGQRRISITAWNDGTYLGELAVHVAVRPSVTAREERTAQREISTEHASGEVTLVVRHNPRQNLYRFEFRDIDNPEEVVFEPAFEPGPAIQRLLDKLDELAEGGGGFSERLAHDYLRNAGLELWQEMIPARVRTQFWERRDRIRQLTILSNEGHLPFELLYPKDDGYEPCGFLVEQFPVTRALFGWRPPPLLGLRPARFVLPERSPEKAETEIKELRALLDPGQLNKEVLSTLQPLLDLIRLGDFGVLHFACHNRFDYSGGSSIRLDSRFEPLQLTEISSNRTLSASTPVVFINACRSASESRSYTRLDGWAEKFLQAGAGAFVGTLWAVRDDTARAFAESLYRRLQAGDRLGDAVLSARRSTARQPGDPTWLAYCVYGNPHARIRSGPVPAGEG